MIAFCYIAGEVSKMVKPTEWRALTDGLNQSFSINFCRGAVRPPGVDEGRLHRGVQLQGLLRLRLEGHLPLQPGIHPVGWVQARTDERKAACSENAEML